MTPPSAPNHTPNKTAAAFTCLVMSVSTLVGCVSAPETPREPIADMPTQFSIAASPTAMPLSGKWWTSLKDPQLNSLIETALTDNFSIKTAWARLDQSEALLKQSTATLFPSLDASGRASRTRNEINSPANPMQRAATTYSNTFSIGLTASYEIDLWGRIRANVSAADLDAQATAFDLQTAAISLSANIANNWYNLITQAAQRDLLATQIQTNLQQVDITRQRFNRGLVGASDLLQQQQLLEATREQKARADLQITLLENQLAILLGKAPGSMTLNIPNTLIKLPNLPDTGLPTELLTRRPDLQAAFTRLQASNQRIAAAIADQYPRLSITASGSTDSNRLRDLFDNWLASIASNIAAPVFDADRRAATVQQRKAQSQQNLFSYAQSTLQALQDVEDSLAKEQFQRSILASIRTQEDIAAQVSDQLEQNYLKGAEDFLRVLTARQSLQNLQRQRLTADRDLILARINLCRAIAGPTPLTKPADNPTQNNP